MTTTTTLNDVAADWRLTARSWTSDACVPTVRIIPTEEEPEAHPAILLGDHPVPLDEHGTDQLLNFYKIPLSFFHRLSRAEQEFILNSRIDHAEGEITVNYSRHGVVEALKPSQPRLHPMDFVDAALKIVNGDAPVAQYWSTNADLRLDVINPLATADAPDGGTFTAGVRYGQNRKANTAPWVAPIMQHSSGAIFQIPDPALKIEARKASAERIAERLCAEGIRAMARADNDLAAVTDLARVSIATDRITILNRVGSEQNIPARPLAMATAQLARLDSPSMYDLALSIAQAAQMSTTLGENVRMRLQAVSGLLVAQHAERCGNCHALIA